MSECLDALALEIKEKIAREAAELNKARTINAIREILGCDPGEVDSNGWCWLCDLQVKGGDRYMRGYFLNVCHNKRTWYGRVKRVVSLAENEQEFLEIIHTHQKATK